MANRFQTPRTQYFANPVTGAPLNGGKLYFYASGTVTPLNTYSDSALTIANTNPVVLNSAGSPAVDIFLQNLAYTVVLTDSNAVTLWSADNVYTSDFSTVAVFGSYAGNPNGNVAGTAASGSTNASVIWDRTNNILYVCTATGSAATATWTAVNASVATSVTVPPQGYITPTTGTPIIKTDTTASTLFYTPYIGNLVPIWNGSAFSNTAFSELTLTLTAGNNIANTIYDVFVFNNSGVVTLGTGPAWTNSATAVSTRGTGAGTTQISRTNGIWTNTVSITLKNGASTYAGIAANQATLLGSILIDSAAGSVTCQVTWGNTRKWGISNAYNRATIQIKGGQNASYLYATNAWRTANSNSLSTVSLFSCLPEEPYELTTFGFVSWVVAGSGAAGGGAIAASLDGGSTIVGTQFENQHSINTASVGGTFNATFHSKGFTPPVLGLQTAYCVENGLGATASSNTWTCSEAQHGIYAKWRG